MNDNKIYLDDRDDKTPVKIFTVIFGILCIFTGGWWTVYLIKFPENNNAFWAASIFLFLFGAYQIYAGLGHARRYIYREKDYIIIRQNSLLKEKKFYSMDITQLEVRPMDIVFHLRMNARFRMKLGLKYPDLGQKIKTFIIDFAEEKNIEIFYKNETI